MNGIFKIKGGLQLLTVADRVNTNSINGYVNKGTNVFIQSSAEAAKTFEAILQNNLDGKKVEAGKESTSRKVTLENWCRPSDTEEEAQRNLEKLNSMSAEEVRNLPEREFNKLVAKCMTFAQEMKISMARAIMNERETGSYYIENKGFASGEMRRLVGYYKNQLSLAGGNEQSYKNLIFLCSSLSDAYQKRGC